MGAPTAAFPRRPTDVTRWTPLRGLLASGGCPRYRKKDNRSTNEDRTTVATTPHLLPNVHPLLRLGD